MGRSTLEYTTATPFAGSADVALNTACSLLMANGFRLDHPTETELIATGPGMHSTSENAIRGVSRARIAVSADTIGVRAELGAVRTMQLFLYWFPPVLAGFFGLLFLSFPPHEWRSFFLVYIAMLPWFVVSPLVARWVKNRTTTAVDTLVHNMVNVMENGE